VVSLVRGYACRLKRPSPIAISVLVVDDEEPVRKFVARVLLGAGYAVTLASDGPDAMRTAASLPRLDIVVSDVMMPHMPGAELGRGRRESWPQLKVLYLTGFSARLFKERVTVWEDEAYLDKPCSIKSLLQAVSLLLFGSSEAPAELGTAPSA